MTAPGTVTLPGAAPGRGAGVPRRRPRRRLVAAVAASAALGAGVALGACGGGSGADPVAFCERLDRLATADPFLAFGDRVGPAEMRAAFASLREQADGLAAVAPEEVRATARDLAGAVRALDGLLAGAAYDGARVDTRAYRNEQLRYERAAARLTRHLDTACDG